MKAIISGAGIAGLAAAVELGRRGWEVLIVERAPALRAGGYMIDFFGPGYDAAEANGLLPALKARSYEVGGVEMVNADGSRQAWLNYEALRASVGGRLFSLLRGDIEETLHEALPNDADLRFGTVIADIHNVEGGVDVTLSSGERVQADLLVGADGIHSGVRAALFGREAQFVHDLGFRTAAYVFKSERVNELVGDKFVMVSVPDRQIGIYALRDGGVTAFLIWRDDAPLDDPRAAIQAAFGDMGWVVPEMMKALPANSELYADITGQVEMDTWHRGRAILLGDSAFAVSLLAGQGASLAIGGAYALGQALDQHADIESALVAYETLIRPEAVKKQAAGQRAAKWFVPSNAFKVWVRALVFNLSSSPFFSRIIESFVATSPKGIFSPKES